ncbi:hypothetical protein [Pontiella sp.]|uniref:hypothetical protein n=1 Tax=Pontiella sp. TaxID=2837462 RepID=UPI0035683AD0
MMKFVYAAFSLILWTAASQASEYKVEKQIGRGNLGQISQLAVSPDDTLLVLDNNGKVSRFKADGSAAGSFESGMVNTTALAVSDDGLIYVFSTLSETKKVKSGARMREIQIPVGVEYSVFDAAGNKQLTRKLDQLKSAKTAKIVNGSLVVADLSAKTLVFHDLKTGKETARVKKGLRLCCGIFDFCAAPDHTVAVSNLGAFKVQRFNMDGELVMEFGKRGRELNDFQGCCNPVSTAYLPDGCILTVEKDPTRIKVYDANGENAKQIDGVEELVKGCSFIPSATDSQGNIYLAANTKGYVVKCSK